MGKVRSKYIATTTLIDGEPYLEPFAATGDAGVTSIVGITGTKAEFDTACTDGAFAYTTACPTITMADAANIALDDTDGAGTKIGTTATQKLGFFGVTPVIQRTNIGAIQDDSGGTPSNDMLSMGDVAADNNFATIAQRLNAIEQIFQDLGLTD